MAVLPNRYMIKLDTTNDYRKTYQHHLGVLRLTIEKASGLGGRKVEKRGVKKLIEKLTKDTPDCYCDISVGAEGKWRTSTKNNDVNPVWNETHDFLVMDYEQCVYVDVQDDDLVGDDDIGIAVTTIRQLLLSGGKQELGLVHKGKPVEGATLTLSSSYLDFVSDPASLSDASATGSQICGLLTVLVASVYGIEGDREKLNPSVKVTWGDKEISTVAKTYSPGVDIFNPSFDTPFRWPVTAEILAKPPSLKVALMDKTVEAGSVEIPFAELLAAPGMTLERDFDVGSGPKIRASVTLRGTKLAE